MGEIGAKTPVLTPTGELYSHKPMPNALASRQKRCILLKNKLLFPVENL